MDRKRRRRAHLQQHLDRFETDVDFLREVNARLNRHPDYEPFSESHLSQIKSGKRNIGDKVVSKLEAGLGLDDGAFDFPLKEEIEQFLLSNAGDQEFEAVLKVLESGQDDAALKAIAGHLSGKDALILARHLIDRAEAAL
ncbi:MAG: hypothetical protein Hals2KO_21300 [Halioglobus sp.]